MSDAPDVALAEVVAACEELVDVPRTDGSISFGRRHGIEVTSAE